MIRSTAPRAIPDGFVPGQTCNRLAADDTAVRFVAGSYDAEARTFEAVLTAGTGVRRWGIVEELEVTPTAVDLRRHTAGGIRLLDSHDQSTTDAIFGVAIDLRFEGTSLVGRFRFADTPRARAAEGMVSRGELTGISIGYAVRAWRLVSVDASGLETWRAVEWELLEASLVSVPADPSAAVRTAAVHQPGEARREEGDADMRRSIEGQGEQPAVTPQTPAPTPAPTPAAPETRAAPAAPSPAPAPSIETVVAAERTRSTTILDIGRRAGLPDADITAAIGDGSVTVEAFRARAFEALAARSAAPGISGVHVVRDEGDTMRRGISDSLVHQLGGTVDLAAGPGQAYRGMTLSEMAAISIGARDFRPRTARDIDDLYTRVGHSASDFPHVFSGAIDRVLEQRYQIEEPTYRRFARRRDFRTLRPESVVRVGDFPMLSKILENGEIKYGTFSEGKETVQCFSYAIALSISRKMLIDDDLGAIADVLSSYGVTVALFEEITFYALALNGLLADGKAVYHADHSNLAGTAAAVTEATVDLGRQALATQKTLDGKPMMANAPSIILTGPKKQMQAEKLVAGITPATADSVNTFSGRLTPVATPQIEDYSWFLFPDPSRGSNYRWGYLNGYTAPRTRIDEPFGRQGMAMSVEHDFGCGATDSRYGFKNGGAA